MLAGVLINTVSMLLCPGLAVLRCEDDLTHKLVEIIRANITLKRMIANGSPQHILNEYVSLLQVRKRCRRFDAEAP